MPRTSDITRNDWLSSFLLFFFFNDPATTEIYPLSLHDALPIFYFVPLSAGAQLAHRLGRHRPPKCGRSEEHTSELQSQSNLVCRLLLEKKDPAQNASRIVSEGSRTSISRHATLCGRASR